MFGSTNPVGQSSSAGMFGSQQQSIFGQNNNNTARNSFSFAPQPFTTTITTNPFGSQTGGSIFAGNSLFSTTSSPFGTTQTGGSIFSGNSSSMFGTTQASSSPSPSTSIFGNNTASAPSGGGLFGTTQTGGSIFSGNSSGLFGTTQASSSTSIFGNNTASAPSGGGLFGTTTQTGGSIFSGNSSGMFGTTTQASSPSPSTSIFGKNTPSAPPLPQPFNFGSTTASGGSSIFGSTTSALGSQTSPFTTTTQPAFGQPGLFGSQQQRGGCRAVAYTPTLDADTPGNAKFQSISAMPVYKEKSHEVLRWEDYQLGDKGGQKSSIGGGFVRTTSQQPSTFWTTQTNPNPFNIQPPNGNQFGKQTTSTGFPSTTSIFSTSGIGVSTTSPSNPFSTYTPTPFNPPPVNPFSTSTSFTPSSPFSPTPGAANTSSTGLTIGTKPLFQTGEGNTSITGLTIGTKPLFQQSNTSIGQTSSAIFTPFAPSTTNAFQSGFTENSLFNSTPSPGTANTPIIGLTIGTTPSAIWGQTSSALFPPIRASPLAPPTNVSLPSLTTPGTVKTPVIGLTIGTTQPNTAIGQTSSGIFAPSTTPSTTNVFQSGVSENNWFNSTNVFGPRLPGSNLFDSTGVFGPRLPSQPALDIFSQQHQSAVPSGGLGVSTSVATNPFGTLPPMPRISTRCTSSAPSFQSGISKMPVAEKPAPVRVSSLSASRHFSQRRISLPARRSHPKTKSARVPFFSDFGEAPSTPEPAAISIPRENLLNGQEAGDAAIVHEHSADIEGLMPKLSHSDYYTEPQIEELAAKEKAEPGFCCRVKDFVVGRHGFGSIKFAGETDVRNLDLESLVQFNNREVIVYLDESKKPPVGQGLNKAAEVTLLNIKCFDKKTGQQYMEGVKVETYKEMLMKKARDQGAEFVSYDPINGDWKFRVNHF